MQHEGTPGGGLLERLGPKVPSRVRNAAGMVDAAPVPRAAEEPRFTRPIASDVA
jgi:hypothetical protein